MPITRAFADEGRVRILLALQPGSNPLVARMLIWLSESLCHLPGMAADREGLRQILNTDPEKICRLPNGPAGERKGRE